MKGVAFTVDLNGGNNEDLDKITKEYYEQYFNKIKHNKSAMDEEAKVNTN